MVPNGHTATYIFFNSIIRLGLFKKPLGFVRAVDLFLYKWRFPKTRNDAFKKKQQGNQTAVPKGALRSKTSK